MARGSSDTARNGEGALLVSAVPPDLCLGYVNTLSWRGRRAPAETLQTISDVLGWIERAAVFSPGAVNHAAAWAQDNEAQAAHLRGGDRTSRSAVRYFQFNWRGRGLRPT